MRLRETSIEDSSSSTTVDATSATVMKLTAEAAEGRLAPNPIQFDVFSLYVRRPTGQMPPYTRTVLSDGELADIYAFLVSIPNPPPVESLPALNED